jgi:hypothetical protein
MGLEKWYGKEKAAVIKNAEASTSTVKWLIDYFFFHFGLFYKRAAAYTPLPN